MTIKLGRRGLRLVLGAGAALVLATTTFLLGAGAATQAAHANSRVESMRLRDKLADAQFTSRDSTGCIQTDVVVLAYTAKETGSPAVVEPMVNVTYAVNDICNALLLRSGFGSTNVINFRMDGGLGSTHAEATVPVSDDQNGTTINLYVNLDWTGVSDISVLKDKDHTITTPGFIINFHLTDSFRDATATGSVSDGTTNFTPPGSTVVEAGLQNLKLATVTIQHG
jgi:hypothetical protein